MAQDDDTLATGLILLRQEPAARDRRYAEHVEEPGRHAYRAYHLGLSATRQRIRPELLDRHPLEHVLAPLPIQIVRRRDCELLHAGERGWRRDVPHHHEPLGILEGQ